MSSIGELDWGARLVSSNDELDWELNWGARLGNSIGELDWGGLAHLSSADLRNQNLVCLATANHNRECGQRALLSVCGVARSVRRPWVNWLLTLPAAYSESMVESMVGHAGLGAEEASKSP